MSWCCPWSYVLSKQRETRQQVDICLGTVFQNRLLAHLAAKGLDEKVAKDAEGFILVLNSMSASAETASYRVAYARAFRNLFEVLLGIAVLGGLVSVFIKHASMDRVLD